MNNDGIVKLNDITSTAKVRGQSTAIPGFDEKFDVDGNGTIDNADNMITAMIDKNGAKTSIKYDKAGNKAKEILPENYDAVTDDGLGTTYVYDTMNRVIMITDAKGTVTNYTYDYAGNITQTVDGNGNKTTYEYNSINKLSKITDAHGKSIEYKYDLQGRLKLEVDRKGQNINYEFNSDDNLTRRSISDTKGKSTAYEYDTLGRFEKVKMGTTCWQHTDMVLTERLKK